MNERTSKKLTNIIIVTCAVVLIYFFITRVIAYFLPFILAYLIAVLIEPLIQVFHRQFRLPRNLSCALSIIIFLGGVGFLGHLLISKLIKEMVAFKELLPLYKERFFTTLEGWSYDLDGFFGTLEGSTKDLIMSNWDKIGMNLTDAITPSVSGSISVVSSLPSIVFFVIITFIATYFVSKDRFKIRIFISRQVPTRWKDNYNLIRKAMGEAFLGYIRAQLILMVFVGIICSIGLAIMGNPYALLMGVVICVVDAFPIFGSGTLLIPWALFQAFSGDLYYAIGLGIIYAVCILTRQLLEPKLISSQVGLHPLATLMSIYVGLQIFGVFGIIVGPLILIFLKTMQSMEVLPKWKT